LYDSYLHVENKASNCTDGGIASHTGIFILNNTGAVNIKGNVIGYNQNHLWGWDSSNITVDGNFLLNVRGSTACSDSDNLTGHGIQLSGDAVRVNGAITNNYLLDKGGAPYLFNPAQSDGLSCGWTDPCNISGNWVQFDAVGGVVDTLACGIIADRNGTHVQIANNVVSNTYNCGIGLADGPFVTATGNKVLMLAPNTSSAQAVTVTDYYGDGQCHDITVGPGNYGYAIRSDGIQGFFGDTAVCSFTETGNTWGQAAYNVLFPIATTNPPPLIPPVPVNCVALSPYSTQTSKTSC